MLLRCCALGVGKHAAMRATSASCTRRPPDGTFWSASGALNTNHSLVLSDSYLGHPDQHARVRTPKARRVTSDRPLGFFFAGQIREGGRADMAKVGGCCQRLQGHSGQRMLRAGVKWRGLAGAGGHACMPQAHTYPCATTSHM